MQPKPIAETSRPLFPRARLFISFSPLSFFCPRRGVLPSSFSTLEAKRGAAVARSCPLLACFSWAIKKHWRGSGVGLSSEANARGGQYENCQRKHHFDTRLVLRGARDLGAQDCLVYGQ